MWEVLVAVGVVVALVADTSTVIEFVERCRKEHKHRRRMEAGEKERPGGNRA